MTTCPACKYTVARGALKCTKCGLSFDQTSGATAVLPRDDASGPASIHSTESSDGARFPAGTIFADRYRIVSLLGRGGMGEVYKAEDLKLKQIVALKFLPQAVSMDGAALARFQNEVRITRQISHPNVCRVYDIGETQGMHFLSMEFIDGEDLSVLLRRIGRLPSDKANEIARQICAGLAAAHDNGVLHRDLKPANIMIDGRGRARVTDFGVSVVAREVQGAEAMSGTPAYMAFEQLTGKEVTQKSDIYSLGLVLYELFTGKRAYNSDNLIELMSMHEASSPTSPSSHVQHLDPLVERVILRCLEKDPKKRPASAIQVAAALPGGDPLAAALAAGETPSPEMVAASGENTGLRPAFAVALLAAVVLGLVASAFVGSKTSWVAQKVRKNSPTVLAHKAEDIIQRLGYTDPPTGTAWGFERITSAVSYFEENTESLDRWNQYTNSQPGPVLFWYRQSPRYLESERPDSFGWVTENDPHYTSASGLVTVNLDPSGRLIWLLAVPPQVEGPVERTPPADWPALFSAAGLDLGAFTPTDSTWTPYTVSDDRAAWMGTLPDQPDIPIRIEAASYRGKPVYFNVIPPWETPRLVVGIQRTGGEQVGFAIILTLVLGIFLGAIMLGRKNLRQGRGDRRGATRLAFFIFAVNLLVWVVGADHAPTANQIVYFFFLYLGQALLLAAIVWLLYIALEPYVRRRWPNTIITWTRVVGGSISDPLVAKDVLVGIALGVTFGLINMFKILVQHEKGTAPTSVQMLDAWLGIRQLIAAGFLSPINEAVGIGLFLFFLAFILRILTRREWIAAMIFVLIFFMNNVVKESDTLVVAIFVVLFHGLTAVVALRLGLLTLVTSIFIYTVLSAAPLTADLTAWYSAYMIASLAAIVGIAGWAFHTSLGGQKLFTGSLLDE